VKQHQISVENVSRETFSTVDRIISRNQEAIDDYIRQLLWWNKRINIISRNVPRETIREHIRHSLILTQFSSYKDAKSIVDAGTGGGLPGIPLALANHEKNFILNDINFKKTVALKQIIRKLSLQNASVENCSIADLQIKDPFLLISKHAFQINQLIRMIRPLNWEKILFFKGKNIESELEGIDVPLTVSIFDLFTKENKEFYGGKAIISIARS